MLKLFVALALFSGSLGAQVTGSPLDTDTQQSASEIAESPNPVIEWNKTLLTIVRTPGAQPPTIHSTRNFAMLHVAMYDTVNDIDAVFSPYLVRLANVPRGASERAAADQAAHDVLVALYPSFQAKLDSQLQQDLGRNRRRTGKDGRGERLLVTTD